ncbi:MAG: T9SS type A sorting domain-containing protein [Bacteroidetes bacterium]|nr:T9SS type A sorting domain-containing protein [Bacteroidota bacterium]MBU1719315.1 T9SS type A sorting domain-containing protein [Bacteroidota bacterium]
MDPGQDAWVVKVDSMGCVEEGCYNGVIEITSGKGQYLGQNYPNPVNCETTIPYTISGDGILQIMDASDRTMDVYMLQPGQTQITISTETYPAGIYLYSIEIGGVVRVTRMFVR